MEGVMVDESRSEITDVDDRGETPLAPRRKASSDHVSAWVMTAWLVAAPLLMLITIWVLTVFRKR